jgi:hypothetical protein
VLELTRAGQPPLSLEVGLTTVSPGFTIERPRLGPLQAGGTWLVDLPLVRTEEALRGLAVLSLREDSPLRLAAVAGPYGPRFDYRFIDLDGDGIPELRLKTERVAGGGFGSRTFHLAHDGFHELPSPKSYPGPLGAAAEAACGLVGGEGCDPIVDFEASPFPVPQGTLLLLQGRAADCREERRCPLVFALAPRDPDQVPRLLRQDAGVARRAEVAGQAGPCFDIDSVMERHSLPPAHWCWQSDGTSGGLRGVP